LDEGLRVVDADDEDTEDDEDDEHEDGILVMWIEGEGLLYKALATNRVALLTIAVTCQGGAIAVHFAVTYPQLVRRLVSRVE
jgi:pimeloyl-ACP methyl ester carboxylesterase